MQPNPNIRKKRNFKALELKVAEKPAQEPEQPVPTRTAPKKRPPPMTLKSKAPAQGSDGLLSLPTGPTSAPASGNRPNFHTEISTQIAKMDLNAPVKYDLRNEDLKELNELGQGNGGSVKKVQHVPTKTFMAKKVIQHMLHFPDV